MKRLAVVVMGILVIALNGVVIFTAEASSKTPSINTLSSIKAAQWNPTIKFIYSKGAVTIKPNGIPNHARDAYYAVPKAGVIVPDSQSATIAKDPTKAQDYRFTIPSSPTYISKVTKTSMGSIGVMISGAVLFNPYEGDGKTVAMASNFTIKDKKGISASFVDKCSGHPTPNSGAYHYHGLPHCVTAKVDKVGKPSHIIGFALDGFPIYGDRDVKGHQITAANLDQCNGLISATPEFPKGIYHYVLLGTADVHSSISCFHGAVDENQIQSMPPMGGQ